MLECKPLLSASFIENVWLRNKTAELNCLLGALFEPLDVVSSLSVGIWSHTEGWQ